MCMLSLRVCFFCMRWNEKRKKREESTRIGIPPRFFVMTEDRRYLDTSMYLTHVSALVSVGRSTPLFCVLDKRDVDQAKLNKTSG